MICFVSGTNTDIGKTFINIELNKALMTKGLKIASLKPIETGVEIIPKDALLHSNNQSEKKDIKEVCFYTFSLPSAPFIADKDNTIDLEYLKKAIKKSKKDCDILMIEGAGGLFVPIKKDYFFIDLIKDLGAFCILISDDRLGCISSLLSAREILENREIDFISITNMFNKSNFLEISYPFLRHLEQHFIYQMQRDEIANFLIQKSQKN
ncbi:MAG: dethiobiotin synthase [Helicobacteraceae bacterium]|nr:dethiobiotin synthase [Helicobacteraceae bacterium]